MPYFDKESPKIKDIQPEYKDEESDRWSKKSYKCHLQGLHRNHWFGVYLGDDLHVSCKGSDIRMVYGGSKSGLNDSYERLGLRFQPSTVWLVGSWRDLGSRIMTTESSS